MSLSKFESMLKTNSIYFFDLVEFEEIIVHYLDTGKHSLAKKAVKLGLEQHPTSIDLKLLDVEILIFDNKLEKASQKLRRIQLLAPANEEVYIQKATILSKNGNHEKAIINLKIAVSHADDKVDIWSMMGMEYLYLDDFEKARLSFAKCIDVDHEDYSSLYNVVYCFDMQKNHEKAIVFLNAFLDRSPYSEVAWHQLGRQYFVLKRYKEALTCFDYAVLIDESFIGGYLEKAKTLEKLGEFEGAIKNYMLTLELDDPTAFAYLRIGECYQKLKRLNTAIDFYKKSVHEDPFLDKGWILLTEAYYEQKDYQKALYYISKALKIDDYNVFYWRKYSDINIKLNCFKEGIKGLEKCLELNDCSVEIYTALSDLLMFVGDFKAAFEVLILAQDTYKNTAEIEYRLSGLSLVFNNEKEGLTHLLNGLKIDFNMHTILKDLFPSVLVNSKVKELLYNYKKAME
jgi:tetratricopeptide (TPR) repeat protein